MAEQRFFFLNLIPNGISGLSNKANHAKWFELQGWDFTTHVDVDTNVAQGAPPKTTKSGSFEFDIMHSGPSMFKLITLGRQLDQPVVFEAVRSGLQGAGSQAGSVTYLQLTFTGVKFVHRGLSGDDGFKQEHVALSFQNVDMIYTPIINGMVQPNVAASFNIMSGSVGTGVNN